MALPLGTLIPVTWSGAYTFGMFIRVEWTIHDVPGIIRHSSVSLSSQVGRFASGPLQLSHHRVSGVGTFSPVYCSGILRIFMHFE